MREGWEVKGFEECIERVKYPKKILKKSFLIEGEFPIISQEQEFINGYWMGEGEVFKVQKPVVIFGDHTKVLKYVDFDFVLGADGVKILQPKDYLYPKYFYYFLMAFPISTLGYARHYRILKELSVSFPTSLAEQKRIVAVLDEAFEGIELALAAATKNLKNARELFETTVSESFFGNHIEKGWKRRIVSELAIKQKGSIRTGPFGSQLLHKEFTDEGIAVLGIDNAVSNEFQWGKRRYISEEKYEQLSRYTVNPGDVIITIMGTCGRCAVIPNNIPKAINSKHLCCISLDRNLCLPEFLHAYFLLHPVALEFLEKRAKGSIMSGLNMGIIKELPVFCPNIAVQKRIVGDIEELKLQTQRLEALYQQKIDALNELKQSLLQKAFAGELTANQKDAA